MHIIFAKSVKHDDVERVMARLKARREEKHPPKEVQLNRSPEEWEALKKEAHKREFPD